MAGTKVLDRTTEGDGTPFVPASGPFNVQINGDFRPGVVQLLCAQDGGTLYDIVEEWTVKPNERHRTITNLGAGNSYLFRLASMANATLVTSVKAWWNQ